MLGTASYLSPEQAQGGPVDARTDIYSLGAVLYEMLAGRPPFMGDTPVAVAYKQVNETPVVPSQLNPDVPARLDAVVMKALSKNPSNRYQTADEFSADLERVIKGQDVEATPLLAGVAAGEATQVISRPQQTAVLPPVEEPDGSGRKVWLGDPHRDPGRRRARRRRLPAGQQPHQRQRGQRARRRAGSGGHDPGAG